MTTTTTFTESAKCRLATYIRQHGPIPAVRVSAVRVQGWAQNCRCWSAVRYEIRLSRRGKPALVAQQRVRPDHLSSQLAERDAAEIAIQEGRLLVNWSPGPLSEEACEALLARLAGLNAWAGESTA